MAITGHNAETWPPLPLTAWRETQETLHLWTQIVGKVKLELTPFLNEWWNVALAVTARGLTTGPIPSLAGTFAIDFDFIDHTLFIHASTGQTESMPLTSRTVADFYVQFMETLRTMGIDVTINPLPTEIPDPIPCDIDHTHGTYDPEFAHRWWMIQLHVELVLQRYRSNFVGKSSPVNFFWGSFDLTTTRFSGRPAAPPEGAPRFLQIAEAQENVACGFWPGHTTMTGITLGEPAFYAYIYPEPPGFSEASVRPAAARYEPSLGQFLLLYEDARRSASPAAAILEFFESTYEVAATLAGWDRDALERIPPGGARK